MEVSSMLFIADIGQGLTIFIFSAAHFAQWSRLWRTQSSEDISLAAVIMRTVAMFLCLNYAFWQYLAFGTGGALLVSSVIGVLCFLITLALIVYFRQNKLQRATVC